MTKLIRRFKWWRTPGKHCKNCCLWCRWFKDCENIL